MTQQNRLSFPEDPRPSNRFDPKPLKSLSENEISRRLAAALVSSDQAAQPEFATLPSFVTGSPIPAAVLIPLLKNEGSWHLLFTRRNAGLPEHSGQVAFPGGRSDPEDTSAEATALREANEEIGLDPKHVHILGRLHDFLTITNYQVTPVVGVISWPYPLRLEKDEVSRAFTIPLEWLADPANHEEQQRELPPPYKSVSVIYFHPYDEEVLWGASARFTLALIDALNLGQK